MRKNITFLVTYFAHKKLLDVCIDSIQRFHPLDRIVMSQQRGDACVNIDGIDRIEHDMNESSWAEVAIGLLQRCETDIAVFIEHDATLLRNIDDVISKTGKYDLIGPEEVNRIRNSPGFVSQNFFIVNAKKLKKIGLDSVRVRNRDSLNVKNIEPAYGISQTLEKKLFLPVTESGYAYGTFYGDVAHHLWYGSYPGREVRDEVDVDWLDGEANRFIDDYWKNR